MEAMAEMVAMEESVLATAAMAAVSEMAGMGAMAMAAYNGLQIRPQMMLWLIVSGLPLAAFAQNAPRTAPVPHDALELGTGQIQAAAPAGRDAALQLLDR